MVWYRWPENEETGIVPWFVILRRLIFLPFIIVLLICVTLLMACGYGLQEAKDFWHSVI